MALRLVSTVLVSSAVALAASACQKEEEPRTLDTAGSGGSGGTRNPMIGLGGSSGSASGGTAGSSTAGSAGAGLPPEGEGGATSACETLAGLDQCGGTRVEATPAPVNVLLVIDKSGSMTDRPEGFLVDKWSAMKEALDAAVSSAPPSVRFGLLLYPESIVHTIPLDCDGDVCCAVPESGDAVLVGVAPGSANAIGNALVGASPGGGTPTAAALARALEYFTVGDGRDLDGERYVLLATDGGPNCNAALSCDAGACTPNLDGVAQCAGANCCEGAGEFCLDDAGVTGQIDALRDAGIATFVVGIPGTEGYAGYLDAFARAGGVPRIGADHDYFAVSAASGVTGLTGVLRGITTELLRSCEVALTEPPARPGLVNVAVDCTVVPKDGESGWDFDNPDAPTSLVLRGPACDELKARGARRIDVVYGCTTIR
jgi:hypothetical protein